ncbi:G-patch domain protein [Ceratobasidium sp. AG-Ba]|nr:G-patch domain protein [Ceratobasidium sp. AG-Ba]QRW14706.1 G-patch domain protein [Ceratobasidium sp. AG-Ba]
MGYHDNQWRDNERHNWRDDNSRGSGKWREDGPDDRHWDESDHKRRRTDYHDARDDRAQAGESHNWDHGGYYEEYTAEEYGGSGGNGGGREEGAYDRTKRDHRRMVPSELSPHVIFLGLDQEFNEADLTAFLATHHAYPTSVTIIRDRNTGMSKCFGFAEFASPEAARIFVEPNFPFIYVPPKASQLAQGYSEENGRRVKIDFSQSAQPRGPAGNRVHNDGTRDIGNTQAPVVLLRGVDFAATVIEISDAIKACAGPQGDGLKGARKVMLARDRLSKASLGFAFVEYVSNIAASRLLAATMSAELHPSGFRIGSRAIAASFAHPASFQPLEDRPPDEYSLICTPAVGGSDSGWCAYWDQSAFVEVQEFEVDPDTIADLTATNTEGEKKKEKKKDKSKHSAQKLAESAGLTVLPDPKDSAAPSTMPLLSKPLSLSLNKTSVGGDKVAIGAQRAAGVFENDDTPTGEELGPDPSKPKMTIWKANPLMQGKKVFGNINKWNNAQGELSGKKSNLPEQGPIVSASSSSVIIPPLVKLLLQVFVLALMTLLVNVITGSYSRFPGRCTNASFGGTTTVDMLKRHSNESALHKTNLSKPELCEAAKTKLEAARQAALATTSTDEIQQPKYRDRAAERRVALRQPDHPMPEPVDKKRKWAEGPPAPAPPPPPPVVPGKDENNVGNKLLKKMGWSEGAGLGTSGEGRVDPVQTALYEQGVGLGASKAKEVTNFQGYREMARDSARERYNNTQ